MVGFIRLLIVLLVVLSSGLIGCTGTTSTSNPSAALTGPYPINPLRVASQGAGRAARELSDASHSAVEKLTTLKIEMDSSMVFEASGGSQPGKVILEQKMAGSVDTLARKTAMNMNITLDFPSQGKENMAVEMYITEGWVYVKANIMSGSGDQWIKARITDEEWAQQSGISNMSELMQTASGIEISGSETVKGLDCHVLDITPDMSSLGRWLQEQLQSSQSGLDLSQADLAETFKKVSVKEWVAKNSKLPIQEQVAVISELTSGDLGMDDGAFDKMTIDINVITNYYDFGQPVTVAVPQEAQNAQEIPFGQ
jgi:hypothetical protein